MEHKLIEITKIGGHELAFQRTPDSCCINLTLMCKPFGKRPYAWFRQQNSKNYLQSLYNREFLDGGSDALQTRIGQNDGKKYYGGLIFKVKGGTPSEQGTWCTHHYIAIQIAHWLNNEYGILLQKFIDRVKEGAFELDEGGYITTADGRKWVSREIYCNKLHRSLNSFAGLKAHYPYHFEYLNNQYVMSREFFLHQSKKSNFEEERISFKLPVEDKRQLSFEFVEYEEITED